MGSRNEVGDTVLTKIPSKLAQLNLWYASWTFLNLGVLLFELLIFGPRIVSKAASSVRLLLQRHHQNPHPKAIIFALDFQLKRVKTSAWNETFIFPSSRIVRSKFLFVVILMGCCVWVRTMMRLSFGTHQQGKLKSFRHPQCNPMLFTMKFFWILGLILKRMTTKCWGCSKLKMRRQKLLSTMLTCILFKQIPGRRFQYLSKDICDDCTKGCFYSMLVVLKN